jgi:hypothetical protein
MFPPVRHPGRSGRHLLHDHLPRRQARQRQPVRSGRPAAGLLALAMKDKPLSDEMIDVASGKVEVAEY